MAVKAIFAQGGLPFWVEVASYLRRHHDWKIQYIICGTDVAELVRELLPGTVLHTKAQAKRWMPPRETASLRPAALDKVILTSLSFHESIFLKMLDRYDFFRSLTYRERVFIYHSQVGYWKAVLDHYRPDIVVFRPTPHMGYDYILYALCSVLGISTIMFERTAIPGLIYPVSSFERGSDEIRTAYRETVCSKGQLKGKVKLLDSTTRYLERLRSDYSEGLPIHLKYKLRNVDSERSIGAFVGSVIGDMKEIGRGLTLAASQIVRPDSDNGRRARKVFYGVINKYPRWRLKRYYRKLAREISFDRPYIFVALQCEPERQAVPAGGVFGNQYLMIDLLAKHLPEDWHLYVKEHVSQFKSYQAAERARSVMFYDYIASRERVSLVSLTVNSFKLIDSAKAVATISGTVAWEAVNRDTPALLFGHSWYRDCEGIFVTHEENACREAINKIANGYEVDRQKILLYAKVLEQKCINAYIDKVSDILKLVSYDQNIENLGEAIATFYTSTQAVDTRRAV